MGWMDFLGGAAAGGIRGLEQLEDRRRRDEDLTENKRRYEQLLQEKAMDRAFQEQQAQRQAAESDAQLIGQGADRDLRERQLKLSEEAASRSRFAEGVEMGREGVKQSFLRDPQLSQYSPENWQKAVGSGVDPRILYGPQLDERNDARTAALQKALAGIRYGPEPRQPMSAGEALVTAQQAMQRLYGPQLTKLSENPTRNLQAITTIQRQMQVQTQALAKALSDPTMGVDALSKLYWPEEGDNDTDQGIFGGDNEDVELGLSQRTQPNAPRMRQSDIFLPRR